MADGNGKGTEEPVFWDNSPHNRPKRSRKRAESDSETTPQLTDESEIFNPAVLEGITEYCPGCRAERPIEEFLGSDAELSYDAPAPRCRACQDRGPPPEEPAIMANLNQLHRRILKAVMLGNNMADAARLAGCSRVYVKNLLKGYGNVSEDFRRAFKMMLEVEGLDFASMTRMAKLLFYAIEPKWNPGEEKWDFFPDNKVRLGMLRHLTKVLELDPPTVNHFAANTAQVNIFTNVGADAEPKTAPGTFTIEDGEVVSSPALEEEAGGER